MKHLRVGRKFGMKTGTRKALIKGLVSNLFLKEKIQTTEARAKEIRSFAERNIEIGKKDGVTANRTLAKAFSKKIVKKIISDISPKYKERKGGYTRVIKLGPRKSDGARMAIIELVK